MATETLPFGVGQIGNIAPFHAQERTSSIRITRFFKQFLYRRLSERGSSYTKKYVSNGKYGSPGHQKGPGDPYPNPP
jgi:hypothetical protein